MIKTAIATDSNSGITQKQAKKWGIFVLPMTFFVNDQQYFEELDISQEQFYEMIANKKTVVATSQPSPDELTTLWKRILKDYDELVYVPMSSGLSNSCTTAMLMAKEFNGRVHVVNNQRISVTQYQSVIDAVHMAEKGIPGIKIKEVLEKDRFDSSIYIMVNDLAYLKRGGRVTPAGALLANVMNLKPVLQIQGEKLDACAKCRGVKSAKLKLLEMMHKDFETRFKDIVDSDKMSLLFSYSNVSRQEADKWKKEIESSFPGFKVDGAPLSLSIGCHIGPGSFAIACSKRSSYDI